MPLAKALLSLSYPTMRKGIILSKSYSEVLSAHSFGAEQVSLRFYTADYPEYFGACH